MSFISFKLYQMAIAMAYQQQASPKTILITGGSRGIGKATALLAASHGWHVIIQYRGQQQAAQAVIDQINKSGGQANMFQADISIEQDVLDLFDQVPTVSNQIDAVVLNAGIVAPAMKLTDMPTSRLKQMVDTNILGSLLCAREAAKILKRPLGQPAASLVFISSAAARLGAPFEYVDYAASKGALDSLTIGLSKELASDNIRVNAVRPGLIDTDIHGDSGNPDRAHQLGQNVPLARPGTAREVAEAIFWLCQDNASYCTGSFIDVTGGR